MILRGMLRLAMGRKSGIDEFGSSLDGFTASIAPLIAFPLVGASISALGGDWKLALVGFLSRLCAVLVLPVVTYEFARHSGREALWVRTATALDWSFWMAIPAVVLAAFAAACMVSAGLDMAHAEAAALGLILGYMLWYHWFIARTGLAMGSFKAAIFVTITSVLLGLFSAGPMLIDYMCYGKAALHLGS